MNQVQMLDPAAEEEVGKWIKAAEEILPPAETYPSIYFPIKGVRLDTKFGIVQVNFKIERNYTEGTARWEYHGWKRADVPPKKRTVKHPNMPVVGKRASKKKEAPAPTEAAESAGQEQG